MQRWTSSKFSSTRSNKSSPAPILVDPSSKVTLVTQQQQQPRCQDPISSARKWIGTWVQICYKNEADSGDEDKIGAGGEKCGEPKYEGKIRAPGNELFMVQFQTTEQNLTPDWVENLIMIDSDKHGEQTRVLVVIRVRTH